MGDWLEMDTDAARRAFDVIAAAGDDLAAGWRRAMAMVEEGEAGFGDDALAAAFRSGYARERDLTRTTGDALPPRMVSDAETGHGCCGDYTTGEERASAALRGLWEVPREGGSAGTA